MADVTPNYDLEKEQIKLDESQLKLNVQSQKFRIMQLEDEKSRLLNNITATELKIVELQDQLKGIKAD